MADGEAGVGQRGSPRCRRLLGGARGCRPRRSAQGDGSLLRRARQLSPDPGHHGEHRRPGGALPDPRPQLRVDAAARARRPEHPAVGLHGSGRRRQHAPAGLSSLPEPAEAHPEGCRSCTTTTSTRRWSPVCRSNTPSSRRRSRSRRPRPSSAPTTCRRSTRRSRSAGSTTTRRRASSRAPTWPATPTTCTRTCCSTTTASTTTCRR